MKQPLILDLSDALISEQTLSDYHPSLEEAQLRLESGGEAFTGWVELPLKYDKDEFQRIERAAKKIQSQCDALVVLGVGGSYLGARAAVEMLSPGKGSYPELYFAGQNLSGTYHFELLELLRDRQVCLLVISKSGTTTETGIAFALFKEWMIGKYGRKEASSRIYAITDAKEGILREETCREGYESFVVPDDIGGRYSVLTPVGLLPIAAAGIPIREMMEGAADMAKNRDFGQLYAAARRELHKRGKLIEVFEYYEPRLRFFAEWLKQLFGESEGKEGKGIFPASLEFSTDLHSMGQFLQEGSPVFFETVLNVISPPHDLSVPVSAGGILAGKSMNRVNQAAVEGVMAAHRQAGAPMVRIDIPALTPYGFGQMVYFFERVCALSGFLLGIDPFNQPGVEQYKAEMRKALGK